jgi:hypothetical protein
MANTIVHTVVLVVQASVNASFIYEEISQLIIKILSKLSNWPLQPEAQWGIWSILTICIQLGMCTLASSTYGVYNASGSILMI